MATIPWFRPIGGEPAKGLNCLDPGFALPMGNQVGPRVSTKVRPEHPMQPGKKDKQLDQPEKITCLPANLQDPCETGVWMYPLGIAG